MVYRRTSKKKVRIRAVLDTSPGETTGTVEMAPNNSKPPQFDSTKSRLAAYKDIAPGVDHRTGLIVCIRDIFEGIVDDLGGNEGEMTTLQKEIALQTAFMAALSRDMIAQKADDEAARAKGLNQDVYDVVEHIAVVRTVQQSARILGLKKVRPKAKVIGSLEEHMKVKYRRTDT